MPSQRGQFCWLSQYLTFLNFFHFSNCTEPLVGTVRYCRFPAMWIPLTNWQIFTDKMVGLFRWIDRGKLVDRCECPTQTETLSKSQAVSTPKALSSIFGIKCSFSTWQTIEHRHVWKPDNKVALEVSFEYLARQNIPLAHQRTACYAGYRFYTDLGRGTGKKGWIREKLALDTI